MMRLGKLPIIYTTTKEIFVPQAFYFFIEFSVSSVVIKLAVGVTKHRKRERKLLLSNIPKFMAARRLSILVTMLIRTGLGNNILVAAT